MNTRFEERLTELPEVPKTFGEDGGHFYRYYDALADEIDDDMVKSLKAQLDGILIYAGLFAGVNSAFLALTLPEMSADPADDTNVLLFHLVTGGGRNITSMDDLPSGSFSPASGMFSINILFSLSLTLALLAAFLAVLGQQWLVYYRKRSGGGADAQRWEQLRRYLGAKRWRLEAILDDILPSLLQLGLVIFCIAFALYLRTLSPWVCYAVAIPMGLALACILFLAISAAVDLWCPFKSPLSRALQLIPPSVARPAWHAILSTLSITLTEAEKIKGIVGRAAGPMIRAAGQAAVRLKPWASGILRRAKDLAGTLTKFVIRQGPEETQASNGALPSAKNPGPKYTSNLISRIAEKVPRPAEPVEWLNAIAVKRILCTSEDPNALIYTGVNLCALESQELSEWLLSNEEVYDRLWEAVERYGSAYGINPSSAALHVLPARVLHSAFIHLVFSSGRADFLLGARHDFGPFPPTATDNTNFKKATDELRSRVRVIGRPLHDHSVIKHLSTTQLGLLLIDFILTPVEAGTRKFDRWFRDHAILAEALGFTKAQLTYGRSAFMERLMNIHRLEGLSKNKEYAAWSLGLACNIVLMYCQCALIRRAQQPNMSQEYPNQLQDDLAHCFQALDEFVEDRLGYIIHSQRINEIARKYGEFLELASEALRRELDIVGKTPWKTVIRLGKALAFSGKRRMEQGDIMTEEFQKEYRRIESALSDEGFLKSLDHSPFSDNPADPPSAQVVQAETRTSNPGGDTATPECNAAIPSQKESVQAP
ncbi:hypothetical protein FS837_000941 [Tulasnella sp. UAMH 9824]|nr:hypothetical protein FS837_000941 [Tulasnella sp. UAMH 9824]